MNSNSERWLERGVYIPNSVDDGKTNVMMFVYTDISGLFLSSGT